MTLQIRPMSQADLATAVGWAADEGWFPVSRPSGSIAARRPDCR